MKRKPEHHAHGRGGGNPPVPKPSTSTRFTHQELQSVLPAPTKSGGRVEYECPKCSRPHLQFFGVDSFKCWGEKCDTSEGAKILRGKLAAKNRSEEHTSELQSRLQLVCRLLLGKKKNDAT